MNLQYIVLRVIRHFIPERFARFLLRRRWVIRPGLESADPPAAVKKYVDIVTQQGKSIKDQRVLILGYGGRFAVGVALLRQGAAHVILCDHFLTLDEERNRELLPENDKYLALVRGRVRPRSQYITLIHGDICDSAVREKIQNVDYVFSTSVLEHLDDVNGITATLASLTKPDGFHLHFVDLRDHYFKYPFEMLTFSQYVWRSFLNPTSNLNRFRLHDYQKIFENHFNTVRIEVLARDAEVFKKTRPRIRTEFITGNESVDAVTLILVIASEPSSFSSLKHNDAESLL